MLEYQRYRKRVKIVGWNDLILNVIALAVVCTLIMDTYSSSDETHPYYKEFMWKPMLFIALLLVLSVVASILLIKAESIVDSSPRSAFMMTKFWNRLKLLVFMLSCLSIINIWWALTSWGFLEIVRPFALELEDHLILPDEDEDIITLQQKHKVQI